MLVYPALALLQPPDCDPASDCGSWVAYPYFITFVVLVSIIMLQLFTAVIIESFEAQEEQDVSDAFLAVVTCHIVNCRWCCLLYELHRSY